MKREKIELPTNGNPLAWAETLYAASSVWTVPFIPIVAIGLVVATIGMWMIEFAIMVVREILLVVCSFYLYPGAMFSAALEIVERMRKR